MDTHKELTPKQEAFAQAVASGMSQSDAYRTAYKVREGTKPETVNQQASRLMSGRNIAARVAEFRKPIAEAAQITLASHLKRLQDLSEAAEQGSQYSAAISAEVARGKAAGLYVEKSEISGANGGPLEAKLIIEYVRPNPAP
jgi:phage terminase small subunit